MKTTAKIISVSLSALLMSATTATAFAAETNDITVSLRIEGADSCILYSNYEISAGSTASDLIQYADSLSDDVTVTGAEDGYITDVNGESAGKFGGWDGWNYSVNAVAPSVGVNDYTLENNDTVVLYYGDYPCYIPQADTSALSSDGKLTFTAQSTEYDDNWNPIVSTVPLVGMTVYFDGKEYTTDSDGTVVIDESQLTFGRHSVQVEKKNENGAPAVCRFASDYTVFADTRVFGDANLDGNVDINDVTYIQLYLSGNEILTDEQIRIADVDKNGTVDINDVTALQTYISGTSE